jgi:hypothetical protein
MENIEPSSDRSFGYVFAVVFCLFALWPYYDRGAAPNLWAGGVSGLFLLAALITPGLLAPLNRLWTRFGLLLSRVTSPIILGIFFFGVIFPISVLMRILGKRPLQLAFDKAADSYWIVREQPGPPPESMKQQF